MPTNSYTNFPLLARRVAGSWKQIPIPSSADYNTLQLLGGDSLVIGGTGAWIWDGSSWSRMGMDSTQAAAVHHSQPFPLPDGTILLYSQSSTAFAGIGIAGKFAKWNRHAWSAIDQTGSGFDSSNVIGLANDDAGNFLVAASTMTQHAKDSTYSMVLRLTGNRWDTLGRTMSRLSNNLITTLASGPGERIAVGGSFFMVDSTISWNLAVRNKKGWIVLDSGFAGQIYAVAVDHDGGIVVGGNFQGVQGRHIPYIARWNGARWDPLGAGVDELVYSLTAHPDGGIVAGGWFQTAGTESGQHVARWDGTSWTGYGDGFEPPALSYYIEEVRAIAVDSTGGIRVGGQLFGNPLFWNGSVWVNPFGGFNLGKSVIGIAIDPHGSIRYVGARDSLRWIPRIWSFTDPSSEQVLSPFPPSVTWNVNGVVALGDSLFAYPGNFGTGPLAIEDHGQWTINGASIKGDANGVVGNGTGNLFLTGAMTSISSGAALPILRWDGRRMVYFTGLAGTGSQIASDLDGRPVVVGSLLGPGGASIFRLNNARPVGIESGFAKPMETAFHQVGRNQVATRSGKLDVFTPSGKARWSGVVPQGFSTGAIDLEPGLHLVRMGSETVHLMVLPR